MVHQRREVPFAHPAIPRLIQKAMFLKVDASFRSEFETEMPVAAIALACTAVSLRASYKAQSLTYSTTALLRT
jgi:hypothetical protein